MYAKCWIQVLALLAMACPLTPSLSAQNNYGGPPQRPTPVVRCQSQSNHRTYCSADTRGGVTLTRQLSQAQCVQGRTWGFDARGIWVQGGCRGEFQVNAYNGNPNWGNPGPGHRPPMPGPGSGGAAGACFYKEILYAGEYFCMRRGEKYANLPPGYNDRISSIKVIHGAEVTVYNDSNFGGRRGTTRRDVPNMKAWRTADDPSRTWNDRVSAIQVR
jgi:Protein of unknown function (DUF3011)/Peptidase inhibitor family I36